MTSRSLSDAKDAPLTLVKGGFLIALFIYSLQFFTLDVNQQVMYSFLHGSNLIFHEAGHVIFMPFGDFMTILWGSSRAMYHPSRSDPRIYLSGTCLLLCCILTLVVWSESYWCRTLCFWCKCSKPPTYRWYEWRSTWLGKPSHYDESPCLWSYYRYSHPLYRHDRDGMSIYLGNSDSRERIFRVDLHYQKSEANCCYWFFAWKEKYCLFFDKKIALW